MSIEIKEELKERVLAFIESQPGYDADNVAEITIGNKQKGMWSILYGENIETGIAGLGDSPEDAFDDFVVKWNFFKGFEWIKKSKMISHLQ